MDTSPRDDAEATEARRREGIEGLALQLTTTIEAWAGEWGLGYAEVLGIIAMLQADVLDSYRRPPPMDIDDEDQDTWPPQTPH